MYSVTNRRSFEEVEAVRDQILRVKDDDNFKSVILLGNKVDLADEDREVTAEEGKGLATSWGIPFLETSAKTRVNVVEAFFELARLVAADTARKALEAGLLKTLKDLPKFIPNEYKVVIVGPGGVGKSAQF
jgi:GTPase SAR1 family protein